MLLQTYGFQNEEMLTVPWMDPNGDPSFSFGKAESMGNSLLANQIWLAA